MSEQDTREQLEADVHQYANPSGCKNTLGACWEKKMLSFLNRQEAITHELDNVWARAQQTRIAELTAERDELETFAKRIETAAHDKLGVTLFGVDYVTEEFMLHVRDTLTAEVEKQKQRANDAERGVLSDEWYVSRDRYEDDVAELKAELESCKLRERVAEDYDYREAAQRWEQAFEDKCCEVIRLKEAVDAMGNGQMYAMYREACEERKRLEHANNTLRASVAGLKATVDRFKARDGSGRGNPGT